MRWGSVFSTLLLSAAAAAAPRILAGSAGLNDESLARLVSTARAFDSGAGLDQEVDRQWRALQNGQVEEVSLDRLAALQDLAGRQAAGETGGKDVAAAFLAALKDQKPLHEEWRSQVLRDSERLRLFYKGARAKAIALIAAGLALTFVMAVLGVVPFGRGLARFFLGMAFGTSARWLMLLSLAVPVYAASSGLNVWPILPQELLLAPIGFMVLSGAFLWMLDPNYPLWNTTLKALGSPVLSCLAVVGWGRLKPAV